MTPILTVFKAFIQRKGKLSDIEFLAIKEFGSKRVDVDDQSTVATTTETDLATQTANTGRDMYLGGASVSTINNAAGTMTVEHRLYINGTAVQENTQLVATNAKMSTVFLTKGLKVAATQIIKITVKNSASNSSNCESELILWEEATGESPQV